MTKFLITIKLALRKAGIGLDSDMDFLNFINTMEQKKREFILKNLDISLKFPMEQYFKNLDYANNNNQISTRGISHDDGRGGYQANDDMGIRDVA